MCSSTRVVCAQDDVSLSHLLDPGLDDVEVHQLPAEEVEGADAGPEQQEEDCQPQEQTWQEGVLSG